MPAEHYQRRRLAAGVLVRPLERHRAFPMLKILEHARLRFVL